ARALSYFGRLAAPKRPPMAIRIREVYLRVVNLACGILYSHGPNIPVGGNDGRLRGVRHPLRHRVLVLFPSPFRTGNERDRLTRLMTGRIDAFEKELPGRIDPSFVVPQVASQLPALRIAMAHNEVSLEVVLKHICLGKLLGPVVDVEDDGAVGEVFHHWLYRP